MYKNKYLYNLFIY